MKKTEKKTIWFEKASQGVFLALALLTPVLSYAASWGAIQTQVAQFQNGADRLQETLTRHLADDDKHLSRREWERLERRLSRMEEKLDQLLWRQPNEGENNDHAPPQ